LLIINRLGGIKCIILRNGGMMNDQKKRATIIFMLILFGGILLGCSTIKSEQSSIIDSEIEKKIEEIVVGGES